jgi:preprotein translocase subunit SecA
VEAQNFESRKHLLEYDDVMNKQREAVYGLRRQLLEGVDQRELILEDYVGGILSGLLDEFAGEKVHPDQWEPEGAGRKAGRPLRAESGSAAGNQAAGAEPARAGRGDLREAEGEYEAKEKILSAATMRYHERMVMLSVIDGLWKDHLLSMDHLKEGINLRGYAQQDPLVEYKRESFDMFEAMMLKFQEDTVAVPLPDADSGPDGQPMDAAPRISRTVPKAPPVASARGR